MAKKNRYKAEQIVNQSRWCVLDTSIKINSALTQHRDTYYYMAIGLTEDDAIEIAQALNYYNNRDKD